MDKVAKTTQEYLENKVIEALVGKPTRNRDGLYVQLQELIDERRGISPKLSLYATLTARIEAVKEQLGGNTIDRRNFDKPKYTTALNGTRIALHEGAQKKPKDYASANQRCSHSIEAQPCPAFGCKKMTRARGKCKSCPWHRFAPTCREHAKKG